MKRTHGLLGAAAAMLAIGCLAVWAEEQNIPLAKVPELARVALTRMAQGEQITRVIADMEDDVATYDAEWQVDGRMHSGMVTESGALLEMQTEVPENQVPDAVKATVAKEFGKGTQATYTRVVTVSWDVEVANRKGSRVVMIAPTGRIETDSTATAPATASATAPASQPRPRH